MVDSAILKNGRAARLTEAGWEIIPWRTDKKSYVFNSIGELSKWDDTHDQWGRRVVLPQPHAAVESAGTTGGE